MFFLFFNEKCCGYNDEALLMSTHNIRVYGEIRKNVMWIPLMPGVIMLCVIYQG